MIETQRNREQLSDSNDDDTIACHNISVRMDSIEFYSRDLWKHSPVYNSFVKLFIKDIHALQHKPIEGYHMFDPLTLRRHIHTLLA